MTEKRRIVLNAVATYGRSLYALILGLFCGRWALMALGKVDYGLYGLVGGMTVFIAFFNGILASANARFYAYSVGAAQVAKNVDEALEECRHWFNTALSVHSVIPLIIIVVGYPIGVYAIKNWLTIPPDRIDSCILVLRFACVSCLFGMVTVPFSAMYQAKQYIAELTIYGFVTSTLNVIVLYYMVSHPDDWLVKYAAWGCFINVLPQIIICVRAYCIFPECRIIKSYMWNKSRLKRVGTFSFWQMFGTFCGMMRNQGMSIVVNKFFGASMNAAHAIGNAVQAQCFTLASAMQCAFTPVITQACGAGDYRKMNAYVMRVDKFNILLSAIFAIPLSLELPYALRLWLQEPPEFTEGLCYIAIAYHLIGACTVGQMLAVNATGRIASYQITLSLISIFTVPIAVIVGLAWRDVYLVMAVVAGMEIVNSIGRVLFAKRIAKTSVRAWVNGVMLPCIVIIVISLLVGCVPQFFLCESLQRICITTFSCEMLFIPLCWFWVLNDGERQFLRSKIMPYFKKTQMESSR